MNGRARLLAVIVAAALLALAAFAFFQSRADGEFRLYGNVDIREVDLGFRQPGRLAALLVDEGDAVMAGDPLARLDAAPLEDQLAAAEAQVARARAELERLQRGARPQERAQADEAVRQADALALAAREEAARRTALAETGAASRRAAEAAVAERDAAEARLASARANASLVREGARREDLAAARAALAAAVAARDAAQTALADAELTAPAAGVVAARLRETGAILAPGAPVFSLSLRDEVFVRAYVDAPDLALVTPGRRVVIETDGQASPYSGRIGFVSPQAEFTPRSVETERQRTDLVYRVRIVVEDADDALRAGMPVTIRFPADMAGAT